MGSVGGLHISFQFNQDNLKLINERNNGNLGVQLLGSIFKMVLNICKARDEARRGFNFLFFIQTDLFSGRYMFPKDRM